MKTFNVSPPILKEDIPAFLSKAGISITPRRIEIAAILLEKIQHLSADHIRRELKTSDMAVSKATVYNTLGLFVARGVIRELIVDGTRTFYDSNPTPHYHFYNSDESTLTDFPSDDAEINNLPRLPAGTVLDSVDLVIRVSRKS